MNEEPQSETPAVEPVTFADLPLKAELQKAIGRAGYDTPTDVQAQIIPHMIEGRDVLAQSQTGSGKTAAFALPILSRLDIARRVPQTLVLAPTRELAIQVAKSFATYGQNLQNFSVAAIYGGQDYDIQFRQLKRGVHVVVGTPGRVIDHIRRGTLDLTNINCLVLDEADEMLNMGFLEDVELVLEKVPAERQIALFSATMPTPIRHIAQRYQRDPIRITIQNKTMTADSLRQRALFVANHQKINVLTRLLEAEETDGVIVFTRTKDSTVVVADALSRQGLSAVALNGDMPQKVRERTIDKLKSGDLDILVATDVAARGLDVSRVSHVFNFDAPHDSQAYIHRVGRTGRAGRDGEAIIFLTHAQRGKLRVIERATKQPIEVVDPPTASDINKKRVERFKAEITKMVERQDLTTFEGLINEYAEESGLPVATIAAAIAQLGQRGRPFFMNDGRGRRDERPSRDRPSRDRDDRRERSERPSRPRDDRPREDRPREDRPREDRPREDRPNGRAPGHFERRPTRDRNSGGPANGMDRYRIEVGHEDGVGPGNIVGAVANEAGLDGSDIGPIEIHDNYSTVDLPEGMPRDIYRTLRRTWVAGKQLHLTRTSDDGAEIQAPRHREANSSVLPPRGKPKMLGRPHPNKPPHVKSAKRHKQQS